jgi:hypothetical protein
MEIQGFPDYLIYNDGRVWSNKRNRFLEGHHNKDNYHCYNFNKKEYRAHRLVAHHYIANPEHKLTVDHINRIRWDNRVDNLRWATIKEQGNNKNNYKNNKSGHRGVCKIGNYWRYKKNGNIKYLKSKTDAICYKFIYLLKIKAIT